MKTMFKCILAGLAIVLSTGAFAQKAKPNKFLEGRKFNVMFYEMKTSGRGKALPTMIVLKGGKIMCDLMEDKLMLPPVAYKVVLDTTYTEDEVEMHMVKLEGEFSEEKNEYKWEGTVTNYDIEGTCVMSKGGLEKKRFEYSGSEKTKK